MTAPFAEPFSEEIYNLNYRFGGEDLLGTWHRVAAALAAVEKDPEYWAQQFEELLQDFKFLPGGRILANAGTGLKNVTLLNCYFSGARGRDIDSLASIHQELGRQMKILASEGGYGFCANFMRPRGAYVRGAGVESPGAVKYLELWDTSSEVITAGSGRRLEHRGGKKKSRRGAQMVTLACWHPDIEEFITAKQTPNRLTRFNMSVLISDAFMEAVRSHGPWSLEFPDYEMDMESYTTHWDGNLEHWKARKLPVKVYRTYPDANELWDLIMTSTYNRNEPGVLFVDTINRLNNLWYCEHINGTNPCSEIPLPIGGVCLLGSFNLTQFLLPDRSDFDYAKLKAWIPVAVRLLDNVNSVSSVPLEEQKQSMEQKRRIGLGVMGYGSALMLMRLRYGSPVALARTETFERFFANTVYRASISLAREKGPFALFDPEKYLQSKFLMTLDPDVREDIRRYGIRNSHLLSIQPTGTSAILANNVSGGLEPVFLGEYVRTTAFSAPPDGLVVPSALNWTDTEPPTGWSWIQEGDERLLRCEFEGYTWKIDRNRGLLRETLIQDYAVKELKSRGLWDPRADWAATTAQLSISDHVATLAIFARYVDQSISKTCNLPADYPYEDFKRLYQDAYRTGVIKGITTYREGTMTSVLAAPAATIIPHSAPVRPEVLPCDIDLVTTGAEKWVVLVGLLEARPFEVFALKPKHIQLTARVKAGFLRKVPQSEGGSIYHLETEYFTIENLQLHFESPEEESLTRLISAALKHGTDINEIYKQLQKAKGTIVSFSKAIARSLAKYVTAISDRKCETCGDREGLMFQEGCVTCKSCGESRCT